MFGLLHRSIFFELTKVFLLAFVGLTGLLLLAGVIAEATRNGLGPAQILTAIPLLIPSTMPYTLPTTTLFATCIIYGRLAADNEILAMRAAGVHIRHAVLPAVALGVMASVLTFVLFLDLIPYTHYILRSQVAGDVRELMMSMLKRESCVRHPRLSYEIHVARLSGERLIDAEFRHRDGTGGYDAITFAKEAQLLVDLTHKKIHVHTKNCRIHDLKGNVNSYVDFKVWTIELPDDLNGQGKVRPSDMTWTELFENRQDTVDERAKIDVEIVKHQIQINLKEAPVDFPTHIQHKENERRLLTLKLAGLDAEIYQRPAFALGCLCFVVVGCPVGIWFSKSDYLSAFITCFLPIVLVYYPLMLCGINMARSGKLLPIVAIGTADALMLFTATMMYQRLARH